MDPEFERLGSPEFRDSAVLVQWNELAVETADEVDNFLTLIGHRTVAMMHLAMHDALNAIGPVYEQYAYLETRIDADPAVAISQAAWEILVDAYPDYQESFDMLLATTLASAPDGAAKDRGVELGKAAAAAIIERREGDDYAIEGDEYPPGDDPGYYRLIPPFEKVMGTGWGKAEPFAMTSPEQFRPGPPPELTSERYARDLNEVKAYGGANSSERSEEQTHIAHWWAEYAAPGYSRIARALVPEHDMHLWEAARLFALFSMDNFDGYVSVFEAKYAYNFWRPQSGIHEANSDGNPATEADPDWVSEMTTVPHPDYPSAHAQACEAGSEIFAAVFGTADLTFTIHSSKAPEGGPATRTYTNIDDAATNCGLSRIYNGFHFRFAIDAGIEMGRARAKHLLENYLQRRAGVEHLDLASL
jgi:hypothetical protein